MTTLSESLTKRKKAPFSLDFEKYNQSEQPLADYGPRIAENLDKFDSSYYKTPVVELWTTFYFYLAAILVLFVAIFLVSFFAYYDLPAAVSEDAPLYKFSEERARTLASHLADEIGNRIVGSKEDLTTEETLIARLQKIKDYSDAERKKGNTNIPLVEFEVQRSSGSHIFQFMEAIITNAFTNITNLVVRISDGSELGKKDAILVNSHYDSTVTSLGGADAAVPISVMVELLSVFTHSAPMKHAIIFLFNGAEESLQEGSYAFITQHPWASTCRVVVNLEACGSGGPELLFQAGSTFALKAFAKAAPYPVGSSFGNDVFSTGIIISDTDYRIFVAYKGITGLDLAYFRNSYVYHTTLDTVASIEEGSIQHMGDNILGVLKEMAESPILDTIDNSKMLYFDILGRAMISYSQSFALLLHLSFLGFVLVFALWNNLFIVAKSVVEVSVAPILMTLWSTFLSLMAGLASSLLVGLIFSFISPMVWFSRENITLVVFGLPAITGILASQWWFFENPKRFKLVKRVKRRQEWFSFLGVVLFYSILLLLTTIVQLGVSYLFFQWTFFLVLALLLNFFYSKSENQNTIAPTYILAYFIPAVLSFELLIGVVEVFVPLTGRMGYFTWADLLISGVVGFFVSLFSLVLIPLSHRAGNISLVTKCFAIISIIVTLLCIATRSPFDSQHPKRVFWQHTNHYVHNSNEKVDASYLLLAGSDAWPSEKISKWIHDPSLKKIGVNKKLEEWDTLYPFSFVLNGDTIKFSAPPWPNMIPPPSMQLISDSFNQTSNLRTLKLKFTFKGYQWSTLRLSADLHSWTITEQLPPSIDNLYVIRHVGRYNTGEFEFSLVVNGQKTVSLFLTGANFWRSDLTQKLISAMPQWTTHTNVICSISSWEF